MSVINQINVKGTLYDIGTSEDDWYGVSWTRDLSDPALTRIGNMTFHRTLPIQNGMKGYAIANNKIPEYMGRIIPLKEDDWSVTEYGFDSPDGIDMRNVDYANIFVKIPEFWYIDDYESSTGTHNLKICEHAKAGWYHHKEAYVGAYEGYIDDDGYYVSKAGYVPTVSKTRESFRTAARLNGPADTFAYNIYTYEEHRAICHLFLVEYATRNSLAAVNSELTAEGYKLGGLGSGCTTGMYSSLYSFLTTGCTDALGNGTGEVTVTLDASTTRPANRYRGIENPFGHVFKHVDDVISLATSDNIRTWYKCDDPSCFATNLNDYYYPIATNPVITTQTYKTDIVCTPLCDLFGSAEGGSSTTYWCDYNYDSTGTSERCLRLGGSSSNGTDAGLFYLNSNTAAAYSDARTGSRLVFLPGGLSWAVSALSFN